MDRGSLLVHGTSRHWFRWPGLLVFCVASLAAGVPTAFADNITLIPSADTSIMEVSPNNNAGGRPWVNAGSNMHTQRNRGLFKFDLAGNIPVGSQITSASLTLAVTGIPSDGYAVSYFDLHRLLRSWGEGTGNPAMSPGRGRPVRTNEADWNSPLAFTTNLWAAPGTAAGTDYVASVTANQIVYNDVQSPYTFPDPTADASPMIADLQLWLDVPATNFGWILISESEDVTSTARRFGSREDPNFPPLLDIGYNPPVWDVQSNQFRLQFTAQAGRGYAVQYVDTLASTNVWLTLTNITPPIATTNLVITDPATGPARFYRLRVQ